MQTYLNNWNLFLKSGLKLKIKNLFHEYFKVFYFSFFQNKQFFEKYYYFNEIKSSILDNYNLKNFNNLLQWYFNFFNFIFNIKNKIPPLKILKKKTTSKNSTIKLLFIIKQKRNLYFFKWIKKLFFINFNNNLKKSLFFILNDTFLNFKNSQLYKYKLSIYKNFLLT